MTIRTLDHEYARHYWLEMHDGHQLHPFIEKPEIRAEDIARGLATEVRFNGHTHGPHPYTVAQHSLCVMVRAVQGEGLDVFRLDATRLDVKRLALFALLHDAHEYVFKDLPRPVKAHPDMAGYKALANTFQRKIERHFGLPECPEAVRFRVKNADLRMLATERRDLMSDSGHDWDLCAEPYAERIEPWPRARAEETFLDTLLGLL